VGEQGGGPVHSIGWRKERGTQRCGMTHGGGWGAGAGDARSCGCYGRRHRWVRVGRHGVRAGKTLEGRTWAVERRVVGPSWADLEEQ
jgi:hypothetical protein